MSSHPISMHPFPCQTIKQLEENQRAPNNNPSWLTTAAKVTVVTIGAIAVIASFTLLPLSYAFLVAGATTLGTVSALSCFNNCFGNGNAPRRAAAPVYVPWYHRILQPAAPYYGPTRYASGNPRSNVPIGGGAGRSDVPIHPPLPPYGRGRGILGGGGGPGPIGLGGHVGRGGGHFGGGPGPIGHGGHVGRGGGHFHN
jgi:hypothetical protein